MGYGKKNANKNRNFKVLIIPILIIILLFILILVHIKRINNKYYSEESRVDQINKSKKTDSSEYKTIGWLRVQGTDLDLPVLSGVNDNSTYPVEKEKYVWTLSDDSKFHNKINIMGHNIFNLSSSPKKSSNQFRRFEELMAFVYYDFAKENKYIQLTIDGEDYLYKIFAVDFINAVDVDMFPTGDYTKDEIKYQIDLLKDNTIYDYDVDVGENDKLISLITCTRFYGNDKYIDFLVSGRLIRSGEKVNDYNVSKNKNYNKVEKILKGDDDDEINNA